MSFVRASYLEVIGRLGDEVTIEEARADVARVSSVLIATAPQLYANWQPRTELAIDAMTERVAGWMRLVLAAVAVLLVIGCANVSNLLLARSAHRARDISVRASLGATRAQLVAGLLAESFLLAGAAVSCGLLAAHWLLELVRATLPAGVPRADLIALDRRVLAASALACVVSALLAGLVPAFQASRTSLAEVLREGAGATASRSRRLWQHAFLVTQVALVTLLLAASTLLVGSFVPRARRRPGLCAPAAPGRSPESEHSSWPRAGHPRPRPVRQSRGCASRLVGRLGCRDAHGCAAPALSRTNDGASLRTRFHRDRRVGGPALRIAPLL